MGYTAFVPNTKKVMISLPDDLLGRIDRAAAERRTSRSAFLQEAARRELGWPDPVAVDAALERARAALADAGPFESADVIRRQRDARGARDARDRRR
jgi:predicted transcriptional regulator